MYDDRETGWLNVDLITVRDAKKKKEALKHLERALAAAGVYVRLEYELSCECVFIRYLRSERPVGRVNVHLDSTAAMLYDIFKQAGPELVAEA